MYVSHEHIEEVMNDLTPATSRYITAKHALAMAETAYSAAETGLTEFGLIHDKEHGTNEKLRKLHAEGVLARPWGHAIAGAQAELALAEMEYDALRAEMQAIRLHLQLDSLALKTQELNPVFRPWEDMVRMFPGPTPLEEAIPDGDIELPSE
jgi:hypothetical protein